MQTQYYTRSEGKLAFTDYGGNGQLVLMFPGMGALRSEYRFLGPKLSAAGYHTVAVDLRGQGESSVPWKSYDVPSVGSDVVALLDYLDSGSAHLIGTSKAAAASVWAALERPETVHSLVLIGPFVYATRINPVMRAIYWLMMNNPWRVKAWIKYYGTLYPSQKPADFKHYLNQLSRNLSEPGRFEAAAAIGNASLQPSEERLRRLESPALVIMGTKDPDYSDPVAVGRYVAEQTGGALELIQGAGHYPQTEMPDKTTPLILDFIKQAG